MVWLCTLILPATGAIFIYCGPYVAILVTAYVCGRFVLKSLGWPKATRAIERIDWKTCSGYGHYDSMHINGVCQSCRLLEKE